MTAMALTAGHASLEAHLAGTAVDAGGLLPDEQRNNSWTQKVEEVDPLELLEVQLCNATAPFILISRLRPAMRAAVAAGARRAYVVNVSAMEGQFSRRYKGPGTRTPTWPRRRSTCSRAPARARCSRPTASS